MQTTSQRFSGAVTGSERIADCFRTTIPKSLSPLFGFQAFRCHTRSSTQPTPTGAVVGVLDGHVEAASARRIGRVDVTVRVDRRRRHSPERQMAQCQRWIAGVQGGDACAKASHRRPGSD